MAWRDPYTTPQRYKAAYPEDDSKDDVIKRAILTWSRHIEHRTGHVFNKLDAAAPRIIYPERDGSGLSSAFLPIPDVAALTNFAIVVDESNDLTFSGTPFAANDYQLYPLNPQADEPWNSIYLPYSSNKGGLWTSYPVRVTAVWGWPEVPTGIEDAVIELVAIWLLSSPRATSRVNDLNQFETVNRDARNVINELINQFSDTAGIGIG